MIVDAPGLRAVLGHVIDQHQANQRLVFGNINFIKKLTGELTYALEHGNADGLNVACGIGIAVIDRVVQRRSHQVR